MEPPSITPIRRRVPHRYVNVRVGNPFQVRVGKFEIPFGLEETTNTMELDFIYRTRGSDELAPARHKGVMAHGRLGRLLEYEFGGFTGDGDNARVWDSDNTFHASDFAITSGHEQNVLMRRAMLVPELRALYFSALAEAAALAMEPVVGAGMGWLEWDIVRQRDLTAQAMQLDPVKPFTNEQVAVAMDEMVAFARGRAAFVMCQAAILTGTMNPLCVVP